MKKQVLAFLLAAIFVLFFVGSSRTLAQTDTPTGPSNDVQGYLVVCADSAVINFTGTMLAGFDIYFQLFAGTTGSGTALTGLRQVSVSGNFSFSEQVPYNSGSTVAAGQSASAKVLVARESDASRVDFDFVLTDVQDGCGGNAAQNPLGSSTEVGSGTTTTDTEGTTTLASGSTGSARHILAPGGGVVNPNLQAEPPVVIGARPSVNFRSQTPGLIFAECNAYPMAMPGLVLDSDQVTIFWSWYTRTIEQMEDHLAHAQYSVKLNQVPFPRVTRSEIERRNGNYWVFYTVNVGNLAPGFYEVEYRLTWDQPVNDGYQDFGPGTDNPVEANNCMFQVAHNPNAENLQLSGMFLPGELPAHWVEPEY